MRVSAVHALGPHPLGDGASVRGEASDGDADMVVNGEDLLLVGREVAGGSLEGHQHRVRVGLQGHRGGPLLHRLHGIFHLGRRKMKDHRFGERKGMEKTKKVKQESSNML